MTFRKLAGGGIACAYCGFCLVMEGPRQCCTAGKDYDALAAQLAAAERALKIQQAVNDLAYRPHQILSEQNDRLRERLAAAERERDALRELLREARDRASAFGMVDLPHDINAALERPCTCHPDDNPPVPCPRKYALTECRQAALERTP